MRSRLSSLFVPVLLLVVVLTACGDSTVTVGVTQPAAATPAIKPTVKATLAATVIATATATKATEYQPAYGCLPAITIMDTVVQACMDKPSPNQNDMIMITTRMSMAGQAVVGAPIKTTWNYKTGKIECSTTSNAGGLGFCLRNIGSAEVGFRVVVEVQYDYKGLGYRGETSFTPIGAAAGSGVAAQIVVAPTATPK